MKKCTMICIICVYLFLFINIFQTHTNEYYLCDIIAKNNIKNDSKQNNIFFIKNIFLLGCLILFNEILYKNLVSFVIILLLFFFTYHIIFSSIYRYKYSENLYLINHFGYGIKLLISIYVFFIYHLYKQPDDVLLFIGFLQLIFLMYLFVISWNFYIFISIISLFIMFYSYLYLFVKT